MTTKQLESPLYESLQAQFEIVSLQDQHAQTKAYREQAMQQFRTLGFPSIKNEEWRFANVLPIVKTAYEVSALKNAQISEAAYEQARTLINAHNEDILPKLKGEQKGAYRLVTINGVLSKELSFLPEMEGVTICPITEAIDQPGFEQYFGKILTLENNAFACLNSALYTDGIFMEVKANVALDMPLHIIKVKLAADNALFQPRNLFVLHRSAELEVIETYISDAGSEAKVLINSVSEIALEENAHFYHYDIQKGHQNIRKIQRNEAVQYKHSNYSNYTFTFPGSSFTRNNLAIHLDDEVVESHLYGLYLTADEQLVDNHTEVHHKKPNGESNQLYKGIIMDKSKAVFNGKIFVYEDAQKTNAFQQSNNVLFSEQATVHAKPQLEIFADDVKCSHGTTIGQLNKEALFYLQSRGIGEDSARKIMVKAFAFDVAEKIKIPALRSYVEEMIVEEMSRKV